ncbi:hypothetical protein Lal_00021423 [Lupinus albus]|nr:hypothetical protein Lal_00021423 [Lupinus albus]
MRVMFGHEEIPDFPTLVNKCRMYEDNVRVRDAAAGKGNPPRNYGPQRNFVQGNARDSRLDEKGSLDRVKSWAILMDPRLSESYIDGSSPERELARLSESGLA